MVFGRKKSVTPARPVPPTVDQILEDLRTTSDTDPVYNKLDQGLLQEIIETPAEKEGEVTEDDLGDPNILYQKVVEYISTGNKVDTLGERIRTGYDTLLNSQKELEQLTQEVRCQVEDTRKRSNVLGQVEEIKQHLELEHRTAAAAGVTEELLENPETEEDSDTDLC